MPPVCSASVSVAALALAAAIVKLLGLVAAAAIKVLLLKGLVLAQASLFVSVLLFLDSVRRKLANFKDTYKIEPVQYPEREPDLSGYEYPTRWVRGDPAPRGGRVVIA